MADNNSGPEHKTPEDETSKSGADDAPKPKRRIIVPGLEDLDATIRLANQFNFMDSLTKGLSRQILDATRVDPDLLPSILGPQLTLKSFTDSVASADHGQNRMFGGVTDSIAKAVFAQQNVSADLLKVIVPINDWFASSFQPLHDLLPQLRRSFPANLVDADVDLDACKSMMMDEGLPIAWVPRTSTIKAIFAAETAQGRRNVYGVRWRSVVSDCEAELGRMSSSETVDYVGFALKAARALRDGHSEAGQALAANTLDTLVLSIFDNEMKKEVTGKARINPDEYSVRQYFVYSQLWGIHRPFYAAKGDPLPRTFNRHGSVHGVSRRQFSRINAVLALAHLTSLLWYVDMTLSQGAAKKASR